MLAHELSTGQRKRLEMARAMATQPKLLLLDEITGGVDLPNVRGLVELVGKLRKEGITLLIIEHNIRVIMQLADRVMFLHLGQKMAEGSPGEVASDPEVRAALSRSGRCLNSATSMSFTATSRCCGK